MADIRVNVYRCLIKIKNPTEINKKKFRTYIVDRVYIVCKVILLP